MSNEISGFNPKIHICKFGFELYDHACAVPFEYKIIVNLFLKEIRILFYNKRTKEIVDAVGFKITPHKFSLLLPLIVWNDFERIRDLTHEWDWKFENGHNGYRDGWGYQFWCVSENGMPIIQRNMTVIFNEKMLPPHEKLLKWLRVNCSSEPILKDKEIMW